VVVLAGSALMLLLDQRSSVYEVAAYCLLIGLGMGLTAPSTLVAAQASVGWGERGVVTANNIFLRSLGSALGIAAFGAVANATIGSAGVRPDTLTAAAHRIFLGQVVIAALMIVVVAVMPRGDRPAEPDAEPDAQPNAEPDALDRASAGPDALDRASAGPDALDRASAAESG
jgi:hypothetical protein